MSDSKNVGYVPSSTNTSYGSNSNDVAATSKVHHGSSRMVGTTIVESESGVARAVVTQVADPGMVFVPALNTTTQRHIAEELGLQFEDIGTQVVAAGERDGEAPGKSVAQAEVEPGVSQELADAANDQLNTILTALEPGMIAPVTERAVAGDPEALEAIGGEDSPLVQSYVQRGEAMAEAAGSHAFVMSNFLNNADKQAARMAVVSGSEQEFNRLAAKSVAQYDEIVEFAHEAADAGYIIEDGTVYEDDAAYERGEALGNLVDIWQQQNFERGK